MEELEVENRERIESLLQEENLRRISIKPEAGVPDETCFPLCEIPRALIEISAEQMESLGPAPSRPHNTDLDLLSIRSEIDSWRSRYLKSRMDIKADPVTELTNKRDPSEITKAQFEV